MDRNNKAEVIKANDASKVLYFLLYISLFLIAYIFVYMIKSHGLELNLLRIGIIIFFASLAGILKTELIKQKLIYSRQIKTGMMIFLAVLVLIILRDKHILLQILIFFKVFFIYNESNINYKTIKNSSEYIRSGLPNSVGKSTNTFIRLKNTLFQSYFNASANKKSYNSVDRLNRLKSRWIKRVKLGFFFNNGLAITYYIISGSELRSIIMLLLVINFIIQLIMVALFNYQLKFLRWKKEKNIISKVLIKKFVSLILILIMLISAIPFLLPNGPDVSSLKVVVDQLSRFDFDRVNRFNMDMDFGDSGESSGPPVSEDEDYFEDEDDSSIFSIILGMVVIIAAILFLIAFIALVITLFKSETKKVSNFFASFKEIEFKFDKSMIKNKLFNLFKVIIANIKGLIKKSKSKFKLDNSRDNDKKQSKSKVNSKKTTKMSEKKQQLMNNLLQFLNLLSENGLSRADSQTINEFFDKIKNDFRDQQGIKKLKEIAGKSFYSQLDISAEEKLEVEEIIESLACELNNS